MKNQPRYLALSSCWHVDESDCLVALVDTIVADMDGSSWSEVVLWDTSDDSIAAIIRADGEVLWMTPQLAPEPVTLPFQCNGRCPA
jgi:hypothetical protein